MNASPERVRRAELSTTQRLTARVTGSCRCDVADAPAEARASANLALLYGGARPVGPLQNIWGTEPR